MVDVPPIIDPTVFWVDWRFWDNTSLVLPVWMWIAIALVFIGFVSVVGIAYVWFVMRPVAGYNSAGTKQDVPKGAWTQVFSIWKNRSFVIESLLYYGNVLAYPDCLTRMQMWLHTSERAAGLSAEKPVFVCRDGFSGTADFVAEMAVCEIAKTFNEDYGWEWVPKVGPDGAIETYDEVDEWGTVIATKQVMIRQEVKDDAGNSVCIPDFTGFRYRIPFLQKAYPVVRIPIYKPYDLSEIYTFTPKGEDALKFGSVIVDDARRWQRKDEGEQPGWLAKNQVFIACCGVCLLFVIGMFVIFP